MLLKGAPGLNASAETASAAMQPPRRLLPLLSLAACACLATESPPPDLAAADAAAAPPLVTGWIDCSGSAPDARSVQRAWRRMALTSHPDKTGGGGSESFEDMTKLRDSLKDPDKFQIHRLLHNLTELTPFEFVAPQLRVTGAGLGIRQQCGDTLDKSTCFPYAALSAEFSLSKPLPAGATWTFALGAKDVSTIQYHGDERAGGYDACCDLLKDSRCVRRPAASPTPALEGDVGDGEDNSADCSPEDAASGQCNSSGGGDGQPGRAEEGGEEGGWERAAQQGPFLRPDGSTPYEAQDCPMGSTFRTEVGRPLHVMSPGLWAATMSLRSAERVELACVAAAMEVLEEDLKRQETLDITEPPEGSESAPQGSDAGAETVEGGAAAGGDAGKTGAGSAESASQNDRLVGPTVSFEYLARGVYCEDGIDVLEGAVDNYSDCTDTGHCFMTGKCKAKCRKRKHCKFYTTFSNGWCE